VFTELLEILAEAVTIRDPHGAIVYANRAALAHLGFASLEDLRRRSSRSIMDDYIVEDEHGRPLTLEDVPSVKAHARRTGGPPADAGNQPLHGGSALEPAQGNAAARPAG
jgi:PAS domain-containing protein